MGKRLRAIMAQIPDGIGMIDVGTDHGYIPSWIAASSYKGNIFASDIREGPLLAAKRTAAEAGVKERIRFLLCDGLDQCDPKLVDTIVIAGMGGDTICSILDRAEWTMDPHYTLILQPMTKAEVLRYWLSNNEYEIIREALVKEGGTIYQILVVRFGAFTHLMDAELFTGRLSMICTDPLFSEFLADTIQKFEAILKGISNGGLVSRPGREAIIREILLQLQEMRTHVDGSGHI